LREPPSKDNKVAKMFEVDKKGNTTILYSVNPGGVSDLSSKKTVIPDLMQGKFKIENRELHFYTDKHVLHKSGKSKKHWNPIAYFVKFNETSAEESTAVDEKNKYLERAKYLREVEQLPYIKYIYDTDCSCLRADLKIETTLIDKPYDGRIFQIIEEDKRNFTRQILDYRYNH
jgi:hypothetical protein